MRVDVEKHLFYGVKKDKQIFFQKAQEKGLIHFIEPKKSIHHEPPLIVNRISSAIKVLKALPVLEQVEGLDPVDAQQYVDEILSLHHQIEALNEKMRLLRLEMARVEVFGSFNPEDLRYIERETNRVFQFYFMKKGKLEKVDKNPYLIFLGEEHGLNYFLGIHKKPTHYEGMIEMHVEKSYDMLEKELHSASKDLYKLEQELKTYQKYNHFLHCALIYHLNIYHLQAAKSYTDYVLDEALFVVEGFIPSNKRDEVNKLLKEMKVAHAEIAFDPDEVPPTCLQNKGMGKIGEDLVSIYDTPSNTDKDPSLWVLFAFAIFFAMIIADAGYGTLFLAGTLYLKAKNPGLKGLKKRMLKLALLLSSCCIAWGLLTNSIFGIHFSIDSPVRKVSILNWLVKNKVNYHLEKKDSVYKEWTQKYPEIGQANSAYEVLQRGTKIQNGKISYEILDKVSDSVLMEIAIFAGVIHILLSLFRYLPKNWPAFGWVIAILGAYLYLPDYLNASSMLYYVFGVDRANAAQSGLHLICVGFPLAVVLSIAQHKISGLAEVTTTIQIFADIMSYLRLYALGLASAIIAQTVNGIAADLPWSAAVLLLFVGHSTNMVLGIVGGTIHGLRLNFIEWYHYSFEGGGKPFKPLKMLRIE